MNIDTERGADNSQVFLVRLWADEPPHQHVTDVTDVTGETGGTGDGQSRVQGKVTHLLSGKASSFSDAATLMSLLFGMMLATGKDDNLEEGEEVATP